MDGPASAMPGHIRKRQRSNPGPEAYGYDDVFGTGAWRYSTGMSPVSDPDIDYNPQSSKRYLSEVMANNLTRHMSLRPSSSAGGPPAASTADDPSAPTHHHHHHHHHPHISHQPQPQPQPFPYSGTLPYGPLPYGPAPLTPPGGCSPQRTAISEMSEGPDPAGGEILQPMLTSDVSLSQGKASGIAGESTTSETADSEVLEERERSVSVGMGGLAWGAGGQCGSGSGGVAGPRLSTGASGAGGGGGGGALGAGPGAGGLAAPHAGGVGLGFGCGPQQGLGGFPPFPSGLPGTPGSPIPIPNAGQGPPLSAVPTGTGRRLSDATGLPPLYPQHHQQQYAQQQQIRSPFRNFMPQPTRGSLVDIPTSPSDTRFGGLDLRKTALLRSISRRTEEVTSDGGAAPGAVGAAGTACVGGAAGACMALADSVGALDGSCGGGSGAPAASVFQTSRCIGGRQGGAGGGAVSHLQLHHQHHQQTHQAPGPMGLPPLPRLSASRSDSALSDGMSEGGGAGGGCGGGVMGMETSSNSADMGGVSGAGAGLDEVNLDFRRQQNLELLRNQQQQQQQQQREGCCDEARPSVATHGGGGGGEATGPLAGLAGMAHRLEPGGTGTGSPVAGCVAAAGTGAPLAADTHAAVPGPSGCSSGAAGASTALNLPPAQSCSLGPFRAIPSAQHGHGHGQGEAAGAHSTAGAVAAVSQAGGSAAEPTTFAEPLQP